MTTQKVTGILRKHGFQKHTDKKVWEGNKKVNYTVGDYNVMKLRGCIGIETYGKKTKNMVDALISEGVNAQEIEDSGIIKVV